jgi:phospholipid/cholesterol/gamma-HCH transport system permease protein
MSALSEDFANTLTPSPARVGAGRGRVAPGGRLLVREDGATAVLTGDWVMEEAALVEAEVLRLADDLKPYRAVSIDAGGIAAFDTLGAMLLAQLRDALAEGRAVSVAGLDEKRALLLDEIAVKRHVHPPARRANPIIDGLEVIGRNIVDAGRDLAAGISFLGAILAAMGRLLISATRFRFTSFVHQVDQIAWRGWPIIVLISFLVGAIVSQQTIFQLQTFGTTAFVADLLGILVLRELAILLTAIMVAGRSGSAFTAEIGSMKMREEIDAMRTMGLDPLEVLILPRILALIVAMPILTFLSSMAALTGGGLVAVIYGGVSQDVFLERLQGAIGLNTFLVGMIKAPFMALVIGLIACMEGLKVRGSAESLGAHTTAAVVKSIFIVIVVDGLFAMFFAAIRY